MKELETCMVLQEIVYNDVITAMGCELINCTVGIDR